MIAARRILALVVLVASPAIAQESPAASAGRIGIGVTLNPTTVLADESLGFLPLGVTNFVMPIRLGARATLEPEFGVFRFKEDLTQPGGVASETTLSNYRVGVGLLFNLADRAALIPYVGPRVGLVLTSVEESSTFGGSTTTTTQDQTGFYFGGALGAQHFFTRHFSLGGEVQLLYTSISYDEESSGGTPPDRSQSLISTNGLVTLRWYF
ncbi:MAG: outer membrane beta-barrel protein [Gemmatimonadaceae bacterium]